MGYAFVDSKCPRCNGKGTVGGYTITICPECHGYGTVGYCIETVVSDIETGKVEMTKDERKQVSDWIYG